MRSQVGFLIVAVGLFASCAPSELPAVHNVVMISLDTLRADHLSLYGYHRPTSPLLDAFAAESIVFERALAPAPNTAPSQMSLMTSLYPREHGFFGTDVRLSEDTPMLAELLSRGGLRTAAFVDGGYVSASFGFDRGFDRFEDQRGGFARILPRAAQWIAENRDVPFFVFLHTYDIHAPYIPPEPYRGMFHDKPFRGRWKPTTKSLRLVAHFGVPISEERRQHALDSYDEGIRYVDDQLASFLSFLRTSRLLDDTLVIVLSDHGEEFGEHGSYLHWKIFYQPNLRIPLIVRMPGGSGAGARISELVESVDVLPTVLELVGQPPLPDAQGRSLVPLLKRASGIPTDATRSPREPRVALAWPPEPERLPGVSVIDGRHQAIFNPRSGEARLFDLESDPMVLTDLAEHHPDVVERLRKPWERWRASRSAIRAGTPLELDTETVRQLEALGYVDEPVSEERR